MPDTRPHAPTPSTAPAGDQPKQANRSRRPLGSSTASLEDHVRGGADAFEFSALMKGISSEDQPSAARPAPTGPLRVTPGMEQAGISSGRRKHSRARWLLPVLALALVGAAAAWLYRANLQRVSAGSTSWQLARYSSVYTPADARTLANIMSRMPQALKDEWQANGGVPGNTVFGRGGDTHLELAYASPGGVVRRIAQTWPTRAWAPAWETLGTVPGAASIRMGLLKSSRGLEVLVEDGHGMAWEAHEVSPNTAQCHWSEWASVR